MLEIRITAPELSEAINNLAAAMTARAQMIPSGTTETAVPSGTTGVAVEPQAPIPEEISDVYDYAAIPAQPAPTVPTALAPVAPAAEPQYTLDMIARAGTALVDAGRLAEVTALLAKYGVEVLTALDPSMYGAIAMDLRAMGAQI